MGAFVGVVLPLKIEAVYIICNLLPIIPKISGHIQLKGGGGRRENTVRENEEKKVREEIRERGGREESVRDRRR